MNKKYLGILIFAIIGVIFIGLGTYMKYNGYTNKQNSIINNQNLNYQEVWNQTFLNYQSNNINIPGKGNYDFTISVNAQGDISKLSKLGKTSNLDLSNFSVLSLKFLGDYNFLEDINFNSSIKVYLNKQEIGIGDLDITAIISGDNLTYILKNINKNIINFFGINGEIADNIYLSFEENKNKAMSISLPKDFVESLKNSLVKNANNSPLYENSKEEETNIINSFLDNKVIEIISGIQISDYNRLFFQVNSDNMINFFNDVGKIISTGGNEISFDSQKDFFKNLIIKGYFDIKNKAIINSKIISEIPIKGTDSENNKEIFEIIVIETLFKMPYSDKFDIDLINTISTMSFIDNKIKIRLKGLIK